MPTNLRNITSFRSLIRYLGDDLDWPIEEYGFDELTFEYAPEELGLKDEDIAKIKGQHIYQLRPLQEGQPWGIFFVEFEKKKLPVVVLRRILSHLVIKNRASAKKDDIKRWNVGDILFISAFGDTASDREIAFAHFHQHEGDLPTLRVIGWDNNDTPLKLEHVAATLKGSLRWPDDEADIDGWRSRWASPFKYRPGYVIRTAADLAQTLAGFAKRIHDAAVVMLNAESEEGAFRKLYNGFKTALIHDLDEEAFADAYAQTITYGLLTAAISRTDKSGTYGTAVVADNIADMVPVTNPFLRDMLETFLHAGGRKGGIDFDELGIQDVVDLLRDREKTDLAAVLRDFGNKTQGEDPVIHFYEHFLSAYNKKLKIQRGVFYTPQSVVGYIVRSVHELLQTEFGLEDGLASTATWGDMLKRNKNLKLPDLSEDKAHPKPLPKSEFFVQILDPATGTATFLVEVIDVIHKHLQAKWESGTGILPALPGQSADAFKTFDAYWNAYVPQALLPRLHGYELLMAPYAIAHMKIGLKLYETGYHFNTEERARIYLTNALEPWETQLRLPDIDALAHEAEAVNTIKRDKRFTIIIGNPPYAGHSTNKGDWISHLLDDYYFVGHEPLREKNSKWLQDDYVKFIRVSQNFITTTGVGVLGFITNHSFLDNPTFRGMRHSLLECFSQVQVLDIHGNSKKREIAPDGNPDENVFDIQQGVAITLAVRKNDVNCGIITHVHLFGKRHEKYKHLLRTIASKNKGEAVSCVAPFFLFIPQEKLIWDEYKKWIHLLKIMPVNVLGFQSHRDHFAVALSEDEVYARILAFRSGQHKDKLLSAQFGISDNRDWQIASARAQSRSDKQWRKKIITCSYRPFDLRWCYFSTVAMDYPRKELLEHVAWRENLCLNVTRQTKASEWRHAVVSDNPTPAVFVEIKDGSNVFPLWLYPNQNDLSFSHERRPNFASDFLELIANMLKLSPKGEYGLPEKLKVEDIFHYIYAVFHSPGYRTRYAEFLKIDFPRLPLTASLPLFRTLAKLGDELVALHLLESPELDTPTTKFINENRLVSKVGWTPDKGGTVWIDGKGTKKEFKVGTSGFYSVPENVWKFHIGGYQVCEKWLKDRKGRTLTDDDLAHYHKIVIALAETIRLMAEIDVVIEKHGGWPDAFASPSTSKA